MPSNHERAAWALAGVIAFAEQTGQAHDGDLDNADEAEAITDFLCDLHHLVDGLSLNWDEITDRGDFHYRVEVEEGSDEE